MIDAMRSACEAAQSVASPTSSMTRPHAGRGGAGVALLAIADLGPVPVWPGPVWSGGGPPRPAPPAWRQGSARHSADMFRRTGPQDNWPQPHRHRATAPRRLTCARNKGIYVRLDNKGISPIISYCTYALFMVVRMQIRSCCAPPLLAEGECRVARCGRASWPGPAGLGWVLCGSVRSTSRQQVSPERRVKGAKTQVGSELGGSVGQPDPSAWCCAPAASAQSGTFSE